MRALAKRLLSDQSGAIAAVYALALPMLIMAGGVAFDYARLAALDTELQNAADQAALAAASQLDGGDTAIFRATTAAQSLVVNKTLFANDGNASGTTVTVPNLVFYSAYNSATDTGTLVDSSKSAAIQSASAKFVQVTVGNRVAKYALTPIMGAINSGNINGSAVASLESSICNVPPLYMAFDVLKEPRGIPPPGTGVLLLNEQGSSSFGYLAVGQGGADVKAALGWDNQIGMCQKITTVTTQPGVIKAVEMGFNTRFQNGTSQQHCPPGGGICSAAANKTEYKDDTCHASSTITSPCTDKIGDGFWVGQTGGKSRYQTYKDAIGLSNYSIGTDRRRLTIAVIPFGSVSNTTPVTPTKWMDVFITRPMDGNGKALRLYVEIIGDSSPALSGLRSVPYLIK